MLDGAHQADDIERRAFRPPGVRKGFEFNGTV